jgi:hypothetical protein
VVDITIVASTTIISTAQHAGPTFMTYLNNNIVKVAQDVGRAGNRDQAGLGSVRFAGIVSASG